MYISQILFKFSKERFKGGCIIVAVLGIMGIINAWKGVAKDLPIIGKLRIIK